MFYFILTVSLLLIMQFFHSLEDEKLKVVKLLSMRFLCCYVAFVIGVPARMLHDKLNIGNSSIYPIQAILFVITGLLLYFMNGFTEVDIGAGNITAVWSYVICGILGFVFIFCLSNMLEHNEWTKKLANCIAYIGQNTKPIMAYHLLFFKPVALIYILVCGLSIDKLRDFPVIIDENHIWMWIFYSISGIALSLLLDKILNTVKHFFVKKQV